jgi:hypothetical protein
LVSNIIIEPLSISQQFVVYGTETDNDSWSDTSDGKNLKGVIVTIDFASLHEPQCKGAHIPGSADSDYEFWTPHDGRHGENQKCFMGQQVMYVRRKQDAECFNGEELERKITRNYCECTEMDYECDVGYEKSETGICKQMDEYEKKMALSIKEDQAA